MNLIVNSTAKDRDIVLSVKGEVDVSCADVLRDAVSAAFAEQPDRLCVDLSEVPYIDSTGIGVLVGAANRAADEQRAFAVLNPQRNVVRVLALLGVQDQLNVIQSA
jgi:anti-sigma B factor antagonist